MWRSLAIGLLCVGAFGAAEAEAPVPAEIVAETRLGPEAGNATHPFAAALDTRRNRLWVLNRVPQSLAIVDLATRRMIGTVPLGAPAVPAFDGWFNSQPYIWMGYDARSDHLLVGWGGGAGRGVMVSVDAATARIAAVRTFPDRLSYRWAINSRRGEVVVAGMGGAYHGGFGLLVMDAGTLQTHADFATRQIEAIAASERTGRLYTVEPSHPPAPPCGMGGPYSATRVRVRNPLTGAIAAQSPREYSYPHGLFVDDAGRRLYLVQWQNPQGVNLVTSDSNAVSILSDSTLRSERRIQYPGDDQYGVGQFASWNSAWLDAPRHRLIVDRYRGRVAALPLTGPSRAVAVPVEGSLFSEFRLAGVLPATGQPVLLIDNAVRLLNGRTLQAGASIVLGATIQDLFLDGKQHRLLAHVDRDIHDFVMLENGQSHRLLKSYLPPRTHLLAVDFGLGRIYHVDSDGWGGAALLEVTNFRGEPTAGGYRAEGEFAALIVTDTPGRQFRLLFPTYPEGVRALKRCSVDLLENGREVKSVALPLTLEERARQLLYAARANRVYSVDGQTMTVYAGSDLATIGTVSLAAFAADAVNGALPGSQDVDAEGKFAYYADPKRNQIAKLRLADGAVVDRRQLTFPPSLPRVDSRAGRLVVADNDGGRVVAVRLF